MHPLRTLESSQPAAVGGTLWLLPELIVSTVARADLCDVQTQATSASVVDGSYGEICLLDMRVVYENRPFKMSAQNRWWSLMIDPLSLGIGIVIGAVVGIGGSIWFVKRKLQQMQNNMFGPMGGMMQDSATQQDQPNMEAVMDMMDVMKNPDGDELDLDDDEVDWKQ